MSDEHKDAAVQMPESARLGTDRRVKSPGNGEPLSEVSGATSAQSAPSPRQAVLEAAGFLYMAYGFVPADTREKCKELEDKLRVYAAALPDESVPAAPSPNTAKAWIPVSEGLYKGDGRVVMLMSTPLDALVWVGPMREDYTKHNGITHWIEPPSERREP